MYNTDLNIFYSGASGGFYLLHCLLMQGMHHSWFPKLTDDDNFKSIEKRQNIETAPGSFEKNFQLVHTHQWNLKLDQWKSTEVWPVNSKTRMTTCVDRPYKIFLTCNRVAEWLTFPGKKIVLFTDVRTQIRFAMYKKAWEYNKPSTFSRTKNILRTAKKYKEYDVSAAAFNALVHADQSIYLQDFVKEMSSKIATNQQQNFTRHWLSNHPDMLLDRCGL